MTHCNDSWFLLHTRRHYEPQVVRDLGLLAMTAYWPRTMRRGRAAPLFPACVFVRDDGMGLDLLVRVIGVEAIACLPDLQMPLHVPQSMIDAIRRREHHGVVLLDAPAGPLHHVMQHRSPFELLLQPMRGERRSQLLPGAICAGWQTMQQAGLAA